jgi:hypothetical protein
MASTFFPFATSPGSSRLPKGRRLRLLVAAVLASALSLAYATFVAIESVQPARDGSIALHVVGVVLAFLACAGGWGASGRRAWGRPLTALAAKANLFLLASAILFAAWDEWAGLVAQMHGPIVALAALGTLQAATLLLVGPAACMLALPPDGTGSQGEASRAAPGSSR